MVPNINYKTANGQFQREDRHFKHPLLSKLALFRLLLQSPSLIDLLVPGEKVKFSLAVIVVGRYLCVFRFFTQLKLYT